MNSRVLPALSLMVAIGIFFAYISPTWSGPIAATKAAIALDDQTLAAADTYAQQEASLVSKRSAIDPAALSRLTAFLPDSVDNVGLILDLNALAARTGLSLSNIDVVSDTSGGAATAGTANSSTPGVPAAADVVGSVNLSLSAVGTYSALQAFLVGIEQSVRLLDIQDIIVKGSDTGVYTYQITLRLYWLR